MSASTTETPTGEPARVFTGIRDVPIYAGESSTGNRLPFGPYRSAELIAIAAIVLPALGWFRGHPDGGIMVLGVAAVVAVVVTVILRMVLPKRRPSLAARASFAVASILPRHACGAPATVRRRRGPQG